MCSRGESLQVYPIHMRVICALELPQRPYPRSHPPARGFFYTNLVSKKLVWHMLRYLVIQVSQIEWN